MVFIFIIALILTETKKKKSCWLWLFYFLYNSVAGREKRTKARHQFSVLFQCEPSLFSLYRCSLEDCEHFPTNAIKYLIPKV